MISAKAVLSIQTPVTTRVFEVVRVMDYYIDSALDTDTDSWAISIGDPKQQLIDVLARDNEVRVDIYGIGNKTVQSLQTGFLDEATLNEENVLKLVGRDITSVATDSQHPPGKFREIRPSEFVAREARELNIGSRLSLAGVPNFKSYYTDGSESYWEVWYRLYRKRKMWMWAEADGTIFANVLNYEQSPVYKFGRGSGSNWIPVETVEWRSNKQQRVWEAFIFGQDPNKLGFIGHASDPKIEKWIRKRRIIITDADVENKGEATEQAQEEIFESTVGALEIKLLVMNPGFTLRQNRMAEINLSEIGLHGEFFVVGSRIVGDITSGLYQEVRLREKNYSITNRVPSDPVLAPGITPVDATNLSTTLTVRWADYFVNAATKFHGPWPVKLFLGVLLSICQQESSFHNERRGQHNVDYPANPPSRVSAAFAEFAAKFANERKFGRVSEDFAVGPMQLLTAGYKYAADKSGNTAIDELYGARWNPKWNIYAAAVALNSKLGGGFTVSPSGVISKVPVSGASLQPTENNIWIGVAAYGEGTAYAASVKKIYESTYKDMVSSALDTAREQTDNAGKLENAFYSPLRDPWRSLGGVSAHQARALGNWQSDNAIDMGKTAGSPIFACVGGVISPGGYGFGESNFDNPKATGWRLHIVSEASSNVFFYQHMAPNQKVHKNQRVKAGDLLGFVGNFSQFPNHLHFAAMHGDPEKMVKDGKNP